MQQVHFSPLSDITSRMTGTSASWPFEVTSVYVNGASKAFTWTNGSLSIPSYTTGIVLVEYGLYLLYDAPSQFLPSDPTNPLSTLVYWENRLGNFISFSNSMRAFETGLTEINVGSVSIRLDDSWLVLSQYQLILPNTIIRIYNNGLIGFKGVASKHTISNYIISINVQKRLPIFDAECHFGDPPHLCRIDRTSNTSFYNGANIPQQFDGMAIPMLFGPQFPYEQEVYSEIDVGPPNPAYAPANNATKFGEKNINFRAIMAQVIPTSSTTGIIGRMPIFQTLVSSPIATLNINTPSSPVPNQRFYKRNEDNINNVAVTAPTTISGEIFLLQRTTGTVTYTASRVWYNRNSPTQRTSMFLGTEEAGFDQFQNIINFSSTEHWFSSQIPSETWTLPAVSGGSGSGTPGVFPITPGGNRWLTANFTGIDLTNNETFVVFTGITGAKNHFDLMRWIIEKHGLTVEPTSFADLDSEFPVKTIQQVGKDDLIPTLGQLVSEMNRDLMTIIVFPRSNDVPFVKKIDPAETASQTLTDRHIAGLQVTNEYRNQAANVKWTPKYARSDSQVTSLFRSITPQNKTLFNSQKTLEVQHVLTEVTAAVKTRWDTVTEIYGSPETTVSFDLVDNSIEIEVGDMVTIDHDLFKNKILVITIEQRPLGRLITGRFFYVNAV